MNLVDRVKNILLSPKDEWPKIAGETETTQSLYTSYIMILAAIGPIAILVQSLAVDAVSAIVYYLVSLGVCYGVAMVVDMLAPTFAGEKNFMQSLKLTAYSYTAAWVGGILQLLGMLGGILGLLAALYSLYTFYLGVTVMKKCPPEKAIPYTVVVVLCVIVAVAVIGAVIGALFRSASSGMMPGN
ncbi:MAG TPA: Yip1 family protein [Casimicrobiaceae bacterium]|nr:Yip1 family protein [Casimicrobiaceae bacterium]